MIFIENISPSIHISINFFMIRNRRCLEGLENMKTSSEAISGYSGALAAVLGGVRFSPLGVPHTKGKVSRCFCIMFCNLTTSSIHTSI